MLKKEIFHTQRGEINAEQINIFIFVYLRFHEIFPQKRAHHNLYHSTFQNNDQECCQEYFHIRLWIEIKLSL